LGPQRKALILPWVSGKKVVFKLPKTIFETAPFPARKARFFVRARRHDDSLLEWHFLFSISGMRRRPALQEDVG
jgi:hypothetical protein